MKAHDLARLLLREGNLKVIISLQDTERTTSTLHALGAPEGAAGGVLIAAERAIIITNDLRLLQKQLEADGTSYRVLGSRSECSKPDCDKPDKGCPGCGATEAACLARWHEKGGKCCPDCNHTGKLCGRHAYGVLQ